MFPLFIGERIFIRFETILHFYRKYLIYTKSLVFLLFLVRLKKKLHKNKKRRTESSL